MINAFKYNDCGNSLKGYLIGLLIGLICNAICVLMSYLMGDIKLSFYGFDFRALMTLFIAIFIQSGAEELVDRYYIYQKLRRAYNSPLVAIIANSLIFMSMHILNPGFTFISAVQLMLFFITASLFVYYYNGLWIAIGMHMAWNFCQSIIFGLPNSGIVSVYSIFKLEAASARNGFFYNVNFGVEASYGACLILLILLIGLCYLNKNKGEKNDIWKIEDSSSTIN